MKTPGTRILSRDNNRLQREGEGGRKEGGVGGGEGDYTGISTNILVLYESQVDGCLAALLP